MKTALLIDDDPIFNFLSSKILERLKVVHQIHTANNGKDAIDLIHSNYLLSASLPDLILLDLNMPILDGFGFIEAFKELDVPHKEKVNIIIVTSSPNPKEIERANILGVTRYLSKPISDQGLRIALRNLL